MKRALFSLVFFISIYAHSFECDEVVQKIRESCRLESHDHPYDSFYHRLRCLGVKKVLLFGYGSLVDPLSASRTVSIKSLNTRKPAVAYGVKRIFHRDVPFDAASHWGVPQNSMARGMLNLVFTSAPEHAVNGVVMQIDIEELESLARREVGYDLVPVPCHDWEGCKFYFAYACMAPNHSPYIHPSILPRPGYYELTMKAPLEYGLCFYNFWLNTTYLADETTTIREWRDISLPR